MPEVVVVGAGVMGASIALELQRAGWSTVVVDKGDAVGGGSTGASSAVVRFGFSTEAGVVAAWESKHRWEAWADHLGLPQRDRGSGPLARFHQTGMLFLEPEGFPRNRFLGLLAQVGVPYEVLDNGALTARFPSLDLGCFWPPRLPDDEAFFSEPDGVLDGWFTPDAGFIDDPQLAARNLMDTAVNHGAELLLRTWVTDVRVTSGRVAGVEFADGSVLDASVVVNAAGPWSSGLNQLAGVTDDMAIATRALRQEVHSANAPVGFLFGEGGTILGDLDLGYYCVPRPDGSILAGGVEADCDPLDWVDDPDAISHLPTVELFEAQVWRLAKRVPGLEVPRQPVGLAGAYDVTDDWLPIYDRTSLDGFYVAIGTSGNQFKNAPVVGQAIAELIEACESGQDHDSDPLQVDCHLTGQTLNLGVFSRNRTRSATTGTVLG
ncbi:MAG: FAD-dependent oxidoreductase [Actinomycetota bacterium]|nr:FAD-dependent oxidoreductase [Actinomycetota bacterium]